MYEVGVARSFNATHQLEGSTSSGDQHEHDYRVEAVVRGEVLEANGMLLDIDVLGDALATCVGELESVDLESLAAFEDASTTVEIVADHIWTHVRELIDPPPQLASLRVTVHESADAWASVDQALHG